VEHGKGNAYLAAAKEFETSFGGSNMIEDRVYQMDYLYRAAKYDAVWDLLDEETQDGARFWAMMRKQNVSKEVWELARRRTVGVVAHILRDIPKTEEGAREVLTERLCEALRGYLSSHRTAAAYADFQKMATEFRCN
jgi:hypothetical protein